MGTITVSNLGKAYKQYPTRWSRLAEWMIPGSKPRHHLKWVMQDVSFIVKPGEAVGIIGVNGAGKSTLLKMITGTTQPTTGGVHITGRVAALLELGMGFHPDFTGRQNAYMAGQLLGYKVEDITRLMPEIEAFAEIGEYIDQPVRVYSSGMQMRLAFSVATAHRPDVLIVDEALSVGDTYFQHKSFDRIREFGKQGTTLLIVSHDKSAIQAICNRAILLNAGEIAMQGEPEPVMDYYNALIAGHQNQIITQEVMDDGKVQTISGTGDATLLDACLYNAEGQKAELVFVGEPVYLKVKVGINKSIPSLVLGCGIKDRLGQMMFGTNTYYTDQLVLNPTIGAEYIYSVAFNANLGVGSYSVHLSLVKEFSHVDKNYEWRDNVLIFEVINKNKYTFVGSQWNEMKFSIETPNTNKINNNISSETSFPNKVAPEDFFIDEKAHAAPTITTKTEPTHLSEKLVIVDVGCRWGFAEKFLSELDDYQIYGFDPDPDECENLNQKYGSKSIKAIPKGLAGESGKRILYLTHEPACSSLIKPDINLTTNYPALGCALEVGQTVVETITLSEWAHSEGVSYVDHIKIDTQGSELEILRGAGPLLQTLRSIEVEVEFNPIYVGQPTFSDVDKFLHSHGFVLWKFSNFVHYSKRKTPGTPIGSDITCYDDFHVNNTTVYSGQVYWANAHYVRDEIISKFHLLDSAQQARDVKLFKILGMPDVVGLD